MKMNKKGHLPTIMLFIIALVLVLTAWFSFLTKSNSINDNAKEFSELLRDFRLSEAYIKSVFYDSVEKAIEKADKNNFEESFEQNFVSIVNERDLHLQQGGNFFGKIRNREYILRKEGEKYILEIKDLFVQSEVGENKLKREFDISWEFHEGIVLKEGDFEILTLSENERRYFFISGEEHSITLQETGDDYADFVIASKTIFIHLKNGSTKYVDVDEDNIPDISLFLNSPNMSEQKAQVKLSKASENVRDLVSFFLSSVKDKKDMSFDDISSEINNKISNLDYRGVIIGEYHGYKKPKDITLDLLQNFLKNRSIYFLEEGYGNLEKGGELFTEGYVYLNNEEDIIQAKKYKEFLDTNGIPYGKIYNQYFPCPDIYEKLDALDSKELLVVYVGFSHSNTSKLVDGYTIEPTVESCFANKKARVISIIFIQVGYFKSSELENVVKQKTRFFSYKNNPNIYFILTDD